MKNLPYKMRKIVSDPINKYCHVSLLLSERQSIILGINTIESEFVRGV